jgi:hypothetical protein
MTATRRLAAILAADVNTMAPCVIIGERCAEILKADHL